MVAIEEVPIQRGEGTGLRSRAGLSIKDTVFTKVTHLADVRPTSGIGLGRHDPTVAIERHANDVGGHDPLGRINESFRHPVHERSGIDASNEAQIPQHH